MTTSSENRIIRDYLGLFEREALNAADQRFRDKFGELVSELRILDENFLEKHMACGGIIEDVFDRLHSIAERLTCCERPKGAEEECNALYGDVVRAIDSVVAFRHSCEF